MNASLNLVESDMHEVGRITPSRRLDSIYPILYWLLTKSTSTSTNHFAGPSSTIEHYRTT